MRRILASAHRLFGPGLPIVPLILTLAAPPGLAAGPELEGAFRRDDSSRIAWPALPLEPLPAVWESWGGSDAHTGRFTSRPFRAPARLQFYLAGYPLTPGIELKLQDVQDGRVLPLRARANPREAWILTEWELDPGWQGREVRLIAVDAAEQVFGWIALSEPVTATAAAMRRSQAASALQLAGLFLLHAGLFLLPGLAFAAVCGIFRSEASGNWLGWIVLGNALVAYTVFWAYFLHAPAGKWLALTVQAASLAAIVTRRPPGGWLGTAMKTQVWNPLLITGSLALAYLAAAYVGGGSHFALGTVADRYLPLPSDNWLPFALANRIFEGDPLRPFVGDWLSSDRPPLQAALVLLHFPVARSELSYQIVGTLAQATVFAGLFHFLSACGLAGRRRAAVLAACALSPTFLHHTLYVWPKLLPAALLLFLSARLLEPKQSVPPHLPWLRGLYFGGCAAGALLAHGGSVFALAAIGLLAAAFRKVPPPRTCLAAGSWMLVLLLPWSVYQRSYDPPGNRLVKWHIAGTVAIDSRGTWETLRDAYGGTSWSELARLKKENFACLVDGMGTYWVTVLRMDRNAGLTLRNISFHSLVPGLGALILGILAWTAAFPFPGRPDRGALRAAGIACVAGTLTVLIWCLLMFGPATTVVHQGSLYAPVVLSAGLAAAICAWGRAAAAGLLCVQASLLGTFWLIPENAAPEGAGLAASDAPIEVPMVILGLVAAAMAARSLLQSVKPETGAAGAPKQTLRRALQPKASA